MREERETSHDIQMSLTGRPDIGSKNLKKRDRLEYISIDGMFILKLI